MIHVGLRIDVDTLRGTRIGVPNLLDLLDRHGIRASFFFSVGPDNMGRHVWRLLRPAFLLKMHRTRAGRLYGWDILTRGTLWPGPVIARRCPEPIRDAAGAGHEAGLHAWDHHHWQARLTRLDRDAVTAEIRRGYDLMADILGNAPDCFAAPGWRVTPEALHALGRFSFRYESDCRGRSLFRPVLDGRPLDHVQVPATLPTYDELVGLQCTVKTYNEHLLSLIQPDRLNVLTIHAEVEGIACLSLFQDLLDKARQRSILFEPLGDVITRADRIGLASIDRGAVTGREGWLSCQGEATDEFESAKAS